jgi:hypothetical protein
VLYESKKLCPSKEMQWEKCAPHMEKQTEILPVKKVVTCHWMRPWLNQHPPVHQLPVLSIGWAAFPHPVPDPVLTQDCTTLNLFGQLTFDPFYLLGAFFPT